MRLALAALLLLLLIAAGPAPRVRHEGTFAAGATFERFVIRQTAEETFELELSAGKTRCTYDIGWIRMRPHGLVHTVDFQGTRRGECAAAEKIDGALVLDREGAGGVVRLIEKGAATELAVERAWEP